MKTTKKDFKVFRKECEKWISRLGLQGWSFSYFHQDDMDDAKASYNVSMYDRTCSLFLNTDWKHIKVTGDDVKKSAFHEICHVLLVRLIILGEQRYIGQEELREETHAVIRTLENTLWKL